MWISNGYPVAAADHCFVSDIPFTAKTSSTVSAHLRWLIDPAADKQQASTQSPASLPPCHAAAAAQPLLMHCEAYAHGSCAYSYLATASHSAGLHNNEPVLDGIRSCPILHAAANSCTSRCIGVLRAARCSQKDRCQQVQPLLVLMPVVLATFGQRCGRPTGAVHDAAAMACAASSINKQQVPCTL
jgi:hypothetical protein